MRLGSIPELDDERMTIEHLLHDPALNALAAAMNQPHLAQAGVMCRRHILLDDRRHVARGERMQVERVLNR